MSQAGESKRKRVRAPTVKRDPVLAALVAKIPGEGATFSRAQRVNLLRMFAMAFDQAYGVELPISIDTAPLRRDPKEVLEMPNPLAPAAPPQPISAPAHPDEIRFFVDQDGFARREPGNGRIRPVDIPAGAELEDERDGDDSLDTIKWADGQWPAAAYPNPITIVKA